MLLLEGNGISDGAEERGGRRRERDAEIVKYIRVPLLQVEKSDDLTSC